MFSSREVKEYMEAIPENTVHLFRSNEEAENFNRKAIETNPIIKEVESIDVVLSKASDTEKEMLIYSIKNQKTQFTRGLPTKLLLATGVKYILTNKIDVVDGLVNGAICQLKQYEENNNGIVVTLWLVFLPRCRKKC